MRGRRRCRPSRSSLFTLREAPKLVLVCPRADADCDPAALPARREFAGKLYDGGAYAGTFGLPGLAIDQLAAKENLGGPSAFRVLSLGERPAGDSTSAGIAFGFGGVLAALGILLGVLVSVGVLPRPRRAA